MNVFYDHLFSLKVDFTPLYIQIYDFDTRV